MIAAIYARKSNDQNGVADEAKSVTRQIEHAKAYAVKKGWQIGDEFVFVDDGISGVEFANRPGFVRLMNALKPRPPFQALVMSEESRLGREMVETMGALKQIVTAGVRVFYYLEDKERTLDSPIEKAMMALETFGAELEREKTRQRVIDAMTRNAKRGQWCGGDCYGYDRIEKFGEPDVSGRRVRQCVRLRINESEAAVVRQIFALCARGLGTRRIAKHLNAEDAPAPRPKCGRPRSWAPSSISAILSRPLYRGELVWNRSQKRDKWGQKDTQPRPEAQWIRVPAPELRIIDEETWAAAHERLGTSRQNYLRHTDGRLWGRPANGVESRYLLTGMAICGECGAGMLIRTRKYGNRRGFFYTCGGNWTRGSCANDLEIPMEMADASVLEAVEQELLTPDVVVAAIADLTARTEEPIEDAADRRGQLQAAIGKLNGELDRLTTAVAEGTGTSRSLAAAIRDREGQRELLEAELRRLDARATPPSTSLDREALQHLDEWRGLLGQNTSRTRQLLRKVLDGRVAFIPRGDASDRWYEMAGQATLEKFFAGIPAIKAWVAVRQTVTSRMPVFAVGFDFAGAVRLAA